MHRIVRIPADSAQYKQVLELRDAVLRRPLGLSLWNESLAADEGNIMLAAVADNNTLIGCVMLQPKENGVMKLRQMAVAVDWQGKGIGGNLVMAAEDFCRAERCIQVLLHARQVAVPFYQKLGYDVIGDIFTEVGIPHLLMQKTLPA